MKISENDYEEEILEKLTGFFIECGEAVSEETLEELALIIYNINSSE